MDDINSDDEWITEEVDHKVQDEDVFYGGEDVVTINLEDENEENFEIRLYDIDSGVNLTIQNDFRVDDDDDCYGDDEFDN